MGEVSSATSQTSRQARLLWSLAWLVLFIGLGLYVNRAEVPPIDFIIRNAIHAHSSLTTPDLMLHISLLGSRQFLVPATVIVLVILAVLKDKRALLFITAAMLGEVILEASTKFFFHRLRPESFFGVRLPHTYSYPSGHALGSMCFYGSLALVAAQCFTANNKWIACIGVAPVIGLVGFSRVYLGLHYPTDILGGYLLGAAWLCLLSAVLDISKSKRKGPEMETQGPSRTAT